MKSLLNALQEGRLIELPGTDKEASLTYLATLIEAIPDFRAGVDFAGAVLSRETAANTAIGLGWACPHGRVPGEGELFCAIGWSPSGIDYGAADGARVHVAVMHYIPTPRRTPTCARSPRWPRRSSAAPGWASCRARRTWAKPVID